jgi:hypothetical protein
MGYCTDASFPGMIDKTINACIQVVDGCHSTASDLSCRRRRHLCIPVLDKIAPVVLLKKLLLIFCLLLHRRSVIARSQGGKEVIYFGY